MSAKRLTGSDSSCSFPWSWCWLCGSLQKPFWQGLDRPRLGRPFGASCGFHVSYRCSLWFVSDIFSYSLPDVAVVDVDLSTLGEVEIFRPGMAVTNNEW